MTTKYSVRRISRYRLTPCDIVPREREKSKRAKSINIGVQTWSKLQDMDKAPQKRRLEHRRSFLCGGGCKLALAAVEDLLALGADIAGLGQRPLGQHRAEELIVEHREEHDVAHERPLAGEL